MDLFQVRKLGLELSTCVGSLPYEEFRNSDFRPQPDDELVGQKVCARGANIIALRFTLNKWQTDFSSDLPQYRAIHAMGFSIEVRVDARNLWKVYRLPDDLRLLREGLTTDALLHGIGVCRVFPVVGRFSEDVEVEVYGEGLLELPPTLCEMLREEGFIE